jgi:hypothetical protein
MFAARSGKLDRAVRRMGSTARRNASDRAVDAAIPHAGQSVTQGRILAWREANVHFRNDRFRRRIGSFLLDLPIRQQSQTVRGAAGLEPISKSPEEDNEASELYEAEEVLGVVFPTDEDAALPLNPSKEALHEPPSHIAA